MIDFIFTNDYEIYGNGEGSLKELIFDPASRLQNIFNQAGVKLVFFVEAAELERIETDKSDPAIFDVKNQIKKLYQEGHEIALHLHPQWYNGNYTDSKWELDGSEYNLCALPEQRIKEIIDRSINYLRAILSDPNYAPISFRAGNWLFQPTQPAAKILAESGIKIDSSVFKGGLQHKHRLDYRPSLQNGYFWKFQNDVNITTGNGEMIEMPIYSEMVPPWRMATKKRMAIQQKAPAGRRTFKDIMDRVLDLVRLQQPLKLDYCRMTMDELTGMMDRIIQDDARDPKSLKPIVAIGHTKDLVDFETVVTFLSYLKQNNIKVSTFKDVFHRCFTTQH